MKNILVFDPDWFFIEEVDVINILNTIDKPDVVILYDHDIERLIKIIWDGEIQCIYFLDILIKLGNIEDISLMSWKIAREISNQFPNPKDYFLCDDVIYFDVDEMFLSAKLNVIIRDIFIFNFLKNNYHSSKYSISLIAFNKTYIDFIFHQCKTFNYKISLHDSSLAPDYEGQKSINRNFKFFKIKNILINTIRFLLFNKNENSKNKLYVFSHRNTLPIIHYLSKNRKNKIFIEGVIDNSDENIIAPNLFLVFFQLIQKIRYFFNKKKIIHRRDTFIKLLNVLFKEKIKVEIDYHEFYFTRLFDLMISRLNQFTIRTKYYKSILNRIKPDSILHTSYVSMEQRILFKLCEKYNIKTFAVEHGLMNEIRLSADIIYSDYLLVWGKASYDSYNSLHPNKNKNKIIISGSPDAFTPPQIKNKGQKGINDNFILVNLPHIKLTKNLSNEVDSSFAPTASLAKGFYIFRAYQKIFTILKNESFHIQVHPMDDIKLTKVLLSKYSNLIFSQGDALENISRCKLLISTSSTLIFDAIKNEKPSISFWPISKDLLTTSLRYIDTGSVFHCFNIEEVIKTIHQIKEGSLNINPYEREKYLEYLIDCSGKESLVKIENTISDINKSW